MKTNIIMVCKITWTKSDPLGMASIADNSVTKMTGNTDVPTPPVTLKDEQIASDLVKTTFPDRLGDADQRIAASNAVDDLDAILHQQTGYVNVQAQGSEKVINGCGFDATSDERTKATVTDQIKSMKLTPKVGGSVKLLVEIPIGATGLFYVVFTNGVFPLTLVENMLTIPAGATGVQLVPRGKGKMTLKGFSAFPSITIVGYATNAAGISAPSNPFTTQILK